MGALIETIPNFSEGRDRRLVDQLGEAVSSPEGAALLDLTMDADHHRSVVTAAGSPEAIEDGLTAAARLAVQEIDLRAHAGAHPRIGALDVAPFVALRGVSRKELVERAKAFGERAARELGLPVFFYGYAAAAPERAPLEAIRKHAFRAFAPDFGGPAPHPAAGAVAVGARGPLIAFNVQLATRDVALAKRIAQMIRTSSGGYPAVKALGLLLEAEGCTQVSMNLTDFRITPPKTVFERIQREAEAAGVRVLDSELIGLMPEAALQGASGEALQIRGWDAERMILERRLEAAGLT